MALPTYIQDPATGRRLGVNSEGNLQVAVVSQPAADVSDETLERQKLYRGFFEDSTGSSDLNVDGSVTPVEFTISAVSGATRWVTGVRLLFNGTNLEMDTNDFRRFGTATAGGSPLTNGVEFFVVQGGLITNFFVNPIVYMGDFFDFADGYLNLTNSVGSQEDFLSFDFDFDVPVVLTPNSTNRVVLKVQDDLTSIDLFKAIARGYRELVDA